MGPQTKILKEDKICKCSFLQILFRYCSFLPLKTCETITEFLVSFIGVNQINLAIVKNYANFLPKMSISLLEPYSDYFKIDSLPILDLALQINRRPSNCKTIIENIDFKTVLGYLGELWKERQIMASTGNSKNFFYQNVNFISKLGY